MIRPGIRDLKAAYALPSTKYCRSGLCEYEDDFVLQMKNLYYKEILGSLTLGQHFTLGLRWLAQATDEKDSQLPSHEAFRSLLNATQTLDTGKLVAHLDQTQSPISSQSEHGASIQLGTVMALMSKSGSYQTFKAFPSRRRCFKMKQGCRATQRQPMNHRSNC